MSGDLSPQPDEPTVVLGSEGTSRPLEWLATFEPGQIVGGRYRIVRLIGAGGMGEVYEAHDLELNEDIAIKAVRAAMATAGSYERLKREINLARQITHRNICRTFDLGRHDGPTGAVLFVTMELLRGQTLAQRIRERGRLTAAEALPIVEQIAAGLSAAHARGIIHRDLKSENVIIDGDRAAITDFGLARTQSGSETDSDVTRPGEIIGTPAYIAPEQCTGAKPTTASDIYAFGVILYEMVTGTTPFEGSTAVTAVFRKVHELPESPRLHVPELDRTWERVILRCLERKPEDRFATAQEAVDALRADGVAMAPSQRQRAMRIAAIAAAVLVAIAAVIVLRPRVSVRPAKPTIAQRPSVAVIGFVNTTGRHELDWLSTALAEMLTTELAAQGRIRTVSGDDVQRAHHELRLPDSVSPSSEALARLSRNLNAELLVHGSYTAVGSGPALTIRVDARLEDEAGRGREISVAESGSESRLFDTVSRIGARMRAAMGVAPQPAAAATAILPSDPVAGRAYSEGLARLRTFDALGARGLFTKAAAAQPNQPMIHFELANAVSVLGYDRRARDEAKRAFELSTGLPREQRLVVEGGYRESVADWPQAMEIYRSLMRFFPDDVDYALRLANVQIKSGNASAALDTVRQLRQLPEPLGSDPRIDVAEMEAAATLGDYPRLQKAAARAIETANRRGAGLIAARAHSALGLALHRQGRTDEALTEQRRALAIYRETGDRAAIGRALLRIGSVYVYRGSNVEARPYYEQARQIGDELGDAWLRAAARNNLAFCAFTRGDPSEGERLLGEMLALSRENGDRKIEATALDNLGYAAYLLGDLNAAERRFRESVTIAEAMKSKQLLAVAEQNVGDALLARGRVGDARGYYEKALAVRQGIAENRGIAESRTALATVAIEQGRVDDAVSLAGAAAKWAASAHVRDVETNAHAVLARAFLAQHRVDDAQREADAAEKLITTTDDLPLRARVAIVSARVALARGNGDDAVRRLTGVSTAMERLVPIRLEAELARAEAARGGARTAQLVAVGAAADRAGFHLIARRATLRAR